MEQTRTAWRSISNYPIDSNATSITVATIGVGRRFYVIDLAMQVETNGYVQMKSGSTNLTGPINLVSTTDGYRWHNGGFPVFVSAAAGDDFIIANPGGLQLNGWAVIAEVPE